jgi:putative DNA primase/helicase
MEVLPEDALTFVLEMIGYALYAGNPLRVAVLLLGPGCNGKSVLLAIIKALIGSENVSSVPLQQLSENRFAAAELFGRLANICGDLDARAIRQTDVFKMLTGGDPIMAERKHRDPFIFTSFALPIFAANEPPISSDQTEAWFSRWLVVPMEKRIPEGKIDPHLAAKLTTEPELEGLLLRAVRGLQQVMERGRFELPPAIQAAREQYRENLDTVHGWVSEVARLDPQAATDRTLLYSSYRQWAQNSGRLPVSSTRFYARLLEGWPDKISKRILHGERQFKGISL